MKRIVNSQRRATERQAYTVTKILRAPMHCLSTIVPSVAVNNRSPVGLRRVIRQILSTIIDVDTATTNSTLYCHRTSPHEGGR